MFENLYEVMKTYGESILTTYQEKILDNAFASGGLIEGSRSYVVEYKEGYYEVEISLPFYWKYVEEGNAPAGLYPNINANGKGWGAYPHILNWIRIKPIAPRPDTKGKVPTPENLAGMIVHSMIENGTEGRHFMEEAIKANEDYLALIDEAVMMDLEKDLDDIMSIL